MSNYDQYVSKDFDIGYIRERPDPTRSEQPYSGEPYVQRRGDIPANLPIFINASVTGTLSEIKELYDFYDLMQNLGTGNQSFQKVIETEFGQRTIRLKFVSELRYSKIKPNIGRVDFVVYCGSPGLHEQE